MNKLLAIIIVFAQLAFTTTHTYAATAIEHYTFHYENGDWFMQGNATQMEIAHA